jgi:hypothetical protein
MWGQRTGQTLKEGVGKNKNEVKGSETVSDIGRDKDSEKQRKREGECGAVIRGVQ